MFVSTRLPSATDLALRRPNDRLLGAGFAVSLVLHTVLCFLLAHLRWSRPTLPPPRFTEVRILRRPGSPRPSLAARPKRPAPVTRVARRPRNLSVYLHPESGPPRRQRRRQRAPDRAEPAPALMAMQPGTGIDPLRDAPTTREAAPDAEPSSSPPSMTEAPPRLEAPGPTRRMTRSGRRKHRALPQPSTDREISRAPEPRRAETHSTTDTPDESAPRFRVPRPARGRLASWRPADSSAAPAVTLPIPRAEPEPIAHRAAEVGGTKRMARLPDRMPGDESPPRVITGPQSATERVPDRFRSASGGSRTRRADGDLTGAPLERTGTSDPAPLFTPLPPAEQELPGTPPKGRSRSATADARSDGRGRVASAPRTSELEVPELTRGGGASSEGPTPRAGADDSSTEEGARRFDGKRSHRRAEPGGATQRETTGGRSGGSGSPGGERDGEGDEEGTGSGSDAGRGPAGEDLDDGPGGRGRGGTRGDGAPDDGGTGERRLPAKPDAGGVYVSTTGRYLLPGAVTGSDYMFHVQALNKMLDEINSRTKLHVTLGRQYLRIRAGGFRRAPVVVFTGHRAFELNDEQRLALRQYVEGGGMIWADLSHAPFDDSFRDEMERIFGSRPTRLDAGHTIYRAFYVLNQIPSGDVGDAAPFEGIAVGDRLGVVITPNRYFAAVGGPPRVSAEVQEGAFKAVVNIYVYAAAHYRAESE